MKILSATIIYLWLTVILVTAQTPIVDSLKTKLRYEQTDTGRIMLYNRLAREIGNTAMLTSVLDRETHYKTALQYADSGLILSQNKSFRKGEAELLRTCGAMNFFLNHYEKAISDYEKAFEISSELNDDYSKAALMYNLALIYQLQGKSIQALKYNLVAVSLMEKLGRKQPMQAIHANISEIYRELDEFEISIEYAQKSIDLAFELGDTTRAAMLYDVIAHSYIALHDTISGIVAFEKSIELYHLKKNHMSEARVLHNYVEKVKSIPVNKKKQMLNRSRLLLETFDPEHHFLAYVYVDLSRACPSDSVHYFQERAIKQAILSKYEPTISIIYYELGNDVLKSMELDKAEKYYRAARKANQQIHSAIIEQNVYAGLVKVYQLKGDYKHAFKILQQATHIQDSIISDESKKHLEMLQLQYELKEQLGQQEVKLKAQTTRQQYIYERRKKIITCSAIAMGLLSLMLVKIILNHRRTQYNNMTLQEQHEEILQIQEELRQSNDELNMYKEYLEDTVRHQNAEQVDKDRRLRNISNNLPGGFIYRKVTTQQGEEYISYISNTVDQLIGIPADQLIGSGKTMISYISDPEKVIEIRKLEQKSWQSMKALAFEYYFAKNGKSTWLYNYSLPHEGENGDKVWDGFMIDITRQKEEESSLEKAKEQAIESDKLKSVFLSNMSHEIRTPMNAILGFIGFVEDEHLPIGKRKSYIHIIRESVTQLLHLVENIIDISKLEVQQIVIYATKFELNVLMKEIEDSWTENTNNSKLLDIILDDGCFMEQDSISSDRIRIRQVLNNLIDNAVKYTDKGYIRFGYEPTGDPSELLFFVEDTGVGVPQGQHNAIFEHFRQDNHTGMKSKYGGTGLGLSVSKGLVERMGGRIWIESTEGQGSTFFFTIKKEINNHTVGF